MFIYIEHVKKPNRTGQLGLLLLFSWDYRLKSKDCFSVYLPSTTLSTTKPTSMIPETSPSSSGWMTKIYLPAFGNL